jgi:type II secretion system protein D
MRAPAFYPAFRKSIRSALFFGCLGLVLNGQLWSSPVFAQDNDATAPAQPVADADADGVGAAAATSADGEERDITVSFPNFSVAEILNIYEQWTGKRIIRDVSILGAEISIETTHQLTRKEAAQFVEKTLLLNGYALVPSGEDTLKIIAYAGGGQPNSEGLPMFTRAEDLPEGDDVVTFIMPLEFIVPEEAAQTLTQVFPPHSYGVVTPLTHAQALVITENSSTIRKMVEFREQIDVPPSKVEDRAFDLLRADAEEVVEALNAILELGEAGQAGGGGQGGSAGGPTALQVQQNGRVPLTVETGGAGRGVGFQAVQPKIFAIPRANRILVVARPVDMVYIGSLIDHLDAPPEQAEILERRLNYMPVSTFLPIAGDTLQRGLRDEEGGNSQISGGETTGTGTGARNTGGSTLGGGFGSNSNSGFGNSGGGSSSFGSNRSSLSLGDRDIGPQSIIVDKTMLVADNVQNILIASGPPEHLAIIEDLLDIMDVRPRQIRIHTVIAQLTLGNDLEFGFDILRTLETVGPDGTKYNGAGVFKSRSGLSQRILDPNTLDAVEGFLPAAQGLTLYGQINPYLNGYLSALEATNRFKVLSRPTIYTQNNREAVIFSGQRIAVPRSSSTSLDPNQNNTNQVVTSAIDFEEVLLRIEVLALINANDEITLTISQVNDDIVGTQNIGGNDIPTIGTQALETTVILQDGATVLLGGLVSEEETDTQSGLPLLVNIPYLGRLFGSTNTAVQRQELLIFIQPEIIDDVSDLQRSDHNYDRRMELTEDALDFALPEWEVERVEVTPGAQSAVDPALIGPHDPSAQVMAAPAPPRPRSKNWFSRVFSKLRGKK